MQAYSDVMAISTRRPCCFSYQPSDISGTSRSLDPAVGDRSSYDSSTMDKDNLTNKATVADRFTARCLAVSYEAAKVNIEEVKKRMKKIMRHVSFDILSTEWLDLEPRTIENRAYLIGSVLPQVVCGLEYVLKEAVEKRLVGLDAKQEANKHEGADPNFNPINRLAEYLMRNNHQYSNFSETSPYVRGLRKTMAKLQREMFMRSDDHLAKVKADAMRSQQDKLARDIERCSEKERRAMCINLLFDEFQGKDMDKVEAFVVQNALRTSLDFITKLPEPLKHCLVPIFDNISVDESPRAYDREEFTAYVMLYAETLSSEVFEGLLKHLKLCAAEYHRAVQRECKKDLLHKYYASCNVDQVNVMPREKLLNLCDTYFESAPDNIRALLRDPRDWTSKQYHLNHLLPQSPDESVARNPAAAEGKEGENVAATQLNRNNSAATLLQEGMRSQSCNNISPSSEFTSNSADEQEHPDCLSQEELSKRVNDKLSLVLSWSTSWENVNPLFTERTERKLLFGGTDDSLTREQFTGLVMRFIDDEAPVSVVEDFIGYLKTSHDELTTYRDTTVKQDALLKFMESARRTITTLFKELNSEDDGLVEFSVFEEQLTRFQNGLYTKSLSEAKIHLVTRGGSPLCRRSLTNTTDDKHAESSPLGTTGQKEVDIDANELMLNLEDFTFMLSQTLWPALNDCDQSDLVSKLAILRQFEDFVTSQVRTEQLNRPRRKLRQQWLDALIAVGHGFSLTAKSPCMVALDAIVKDAVDRNGSDRIIAHISLLEPTFDEQFSQKRSPAYQPSLKCVAATPVSLASWMVGNTPPAFIHNLSLEVIKSGRTVFMDSLPSVNSSTGHTCENSLQSEDERRETSDSKQILWDNYCADLANGGESVDTTLHMSSEATRSIPCSILPITSPNHRRVGALVVEQPASSLNHPILKQDLRFYQEVAARLGYAFTLIGIRKWIIRAVMGAFHWFGQYMEEDERVTYYYLLDRSRAERNMAAADVHIENNKAIGNCGHVLLRLVTKTSNDTAVLHSNPEVMTVTGEYIRSHLFEAVEYAGPVERTVLGEHHLTLPLMNIGQVLGVVDVQTLNRQEVRAKNQTQVLKMMSILTMLYNKAARDAGLIPTIPCVHGTEYNERNRLTAMKPETVFGNMLKAEMKLLATELASKNWRNVQPSSATTQLMEAAANILHSVDLDTESEVKRGGREESSGMTIEEKLGRFDLLTSSSNTNLHQLHQLVSGCSKKEAELSGNHQVTLLYRWLKCCLSAMELKSTENQLLLTT